MQNFNELDINQLYQLYVTECKGITQPEDLDWLAKMYRLPYDDENNIIFDNSERLMSYSKLAKTYGISVNDAKNFDKNLDSLRTRLINDIIKFRKANSLHKAPKINKKSPKRIEKVQLKQLSEDDKLKLHNQEQSYKKSNML